MSSPEKVLVAMSGGVDSSTSALLLKKLGYECMGVTMKLLDNELGLRNDTCGKTCCSLEDVEDARSVAGKLHIPYYVFNFTGEFEEKVIAPFVDAYLHGRTPNPCIDCNRYLKFGQLLKRAKELGCNKIATGHYARIEYRRETGRYCLKKAADAAKDQSYVLYGMTQDELAHTLFPLGSYQKDMVRRMAQAGGLINAGKKDSQDICFVPDGDYAGFVEEYLGLRGNKSGRFGKCSDCKIASGDFVDKEGRILGTHRGICHYTIGQRKGLGISGEKPYYVCEIDPETNRILLGADEDLYKDRLFAEQFNWISVDPAEKREDTGIAKERGRRALRGQTHKPAAGAELIAVYRCHAKIRYRHKEAAATANCYSDGSVELLFDEPQRAVTKGQAVVLYDGEYVLGGGVICG